MDHPKTNPSLSTPRTFVIIPVHNRREMTINCLTRLENTGTLGWTEVVVVDDGSTDGTSEAVGARFPSVTRLRGDGSLWWGGGIRLGMEYAREHGAECTVWLNNDCLPQAGVLRLLVDHAMQTGGIASGYAVTPTGGYYGGFSRAASGMLSVPAPPPGETLACDGAAGNCLAIARPVVDALGLPDAASLPHTSLDADYTLDATRRGFALDLLGSAICENEDNTMDASSSWLWSDASPWRQWKIFLGPRSSYNYRTWFHLLYKHWGWRGILLYAKTYLRLAVICVVRSLVPLSFLHKLRARCHAG